MRRDNEDMDVITRSEFDEAMKQVITKEDLQAALGDTKAEIVDVITSELSRARLRNMTDFRDELAKAKLEIVSVNKKNIADGIAPLSARLDKVDGRLDKVDGRLDKIDVEMAIVNRRLNGLEVSQSKMAQDIDKLGVDMADGFHELGEQLKAARS